MRHPLLLRRSQSLAIAAVLICFSGCHRESVDRPLSSVMLNALADPAVLKVVLLGEYQVRDFVFRRNALTLPGIANTPDCWARIAADPGQYVSIENRSNSPRTVRLILAWGSSVVVDHTGVLLTNAHVVQADDVRPYVLGPAVESLVRGLYEPPSSSIRLFSALPGLQPQAFGCTSRWPNDKEFIDNLTQRLYVWMIRATVISSSRSRAYVVTRPREIPSPLIAGLGSRNFALSDSLARLLEGNRPVVPDPTLIVPGLPSRSDAPEDYAMEADVVARGQEYPGEDVAVLKTRQRLDLISLPMGDSSEASLPRGTEVVSFGFPGAAEIEGLTLDPAHPKVIPHPGKIGQRVMTTKNWEALFYDSNVNHGDSGGPIVDPYGKVVGLNDAGNSKVAGNDVGVPIDLAKKYLTQAGITPDVGSVTGHWIKGQTYVSQREWAKALEQFEIVDGTRPDPDAKDTRPFFQRLWGKKTDDGSSPIIKAFYRHNPNDYVAEAIATCKSHLQAK